MIKETYARAYTEVLEMLKYLPYEELNRIPKEKIDFFERNKDNYYKFKISLEKPLAEQNISIEANSVIITLFRDYFATDKQREKLKNILEQNEMSYQEEIREKYNPDNLFKRQEQEKNAEEVVTNQVALVEYKESIFKKIINKIKNIFHIKVK